jgi:SAM-dependent methyltransferase
MTPDGLAVSHLGLEDIIQKDGEYILYGFFKCENPECNIKYPIIEGVPCFIIPTEKYWWSELATVLDTLNPPSQIKQHVLKIRTDEPISSHSHTKGTRYPSYGEECLMGCFMDNNYGEFEPNYQPPYQCADYRPYWKTVIDTSRPGTENEYGMILDLGCSVGRYTFEMARMSKLVVGLDLRFRSVLEAARFQRHGGVVYNRRVRGLKFEEVSTNFEPPENTLFLAGNAMDPPFISESFDLVAGLNLMDNIKLPRILLGQMNALLRSGGILLLGSPYEWRLDICEPTEWLETEKMDGPEMLRCILDGKVLSEYGFDYTVESQEDITWPLRNHDRYWSIFRSNLIKAKKR